MFRRRLTQFIPEVSRRRFFSAIGYSSIFFATAIFAIADAAAADRAYVSNEKDATLSVIDLNTLEVIDTIHLRERLRHRSGNGPKNK